MPDPVASLPLFETQPPGAPAAGHVALPRITGLWICLFFPGLPLEAHHGTVADPRSVAVFESGAVHLAGDAAHAAGVARGLSLNAALALYPGLLPRDRRPDQEAALLRRLAAWACSYSSRVSLEPPDSLLMEIGGSLRLFGGQEALIRRLAADLRHMGHETRIASAPTPTAALWLARRGATGVTEPEALAGALGRLPLAVTRWPAAVRERLHGMGITRVAECLRLPRDGFARRFGKERLAQLDRAVGRCPDPRAGFSPPEHFEAGVDLPAESMDFGCLLRASEPVLARMEVFLRARQAGVTWLEVGFRHLGHPVSGLCLRLVRPARRARYFIELLEARLERHSLEAPVIGLDFRSSRILRLSSKAASLFAAGDSRPVDPGQHLTERLRARLGEEAVHALCLLAEHRPESAWQVAEPGPSPAAPAMPPRPFWLLEEPVRLETRAGRPAVNGPLVPESGPERIETGWWDGHDVARDYYVARDRSGVRLWIFREVRGDRGWYLHGVFG